MINELGVSAKVIADSKAGPHRVTTFEVTFHRFVLAEFNTHRVLSRNSASSRAIPVEKQLKRFRMSPAVPVAFPAEQPGMQGGTSLEGEDLIDACELLDQWHEMTEELVGEYIDEHPDKPGRLHKSIINRLMEPMMWHTVIVTGTDWDGFFQQRVSPNAQPEIHAVAKLMKQAYEDSKPTKLTNGDWHLPYVTQEEREELGIYACIKLSTARCARVSYLTHDGKSDTVKDMQLYDRLVEARPAHASPLEHPCRADFLNTRIATWTMLDGTEMTKELPNIGNFLGFTQARHLELGF